MKNITTNKLQTELSKVIKEVESTGEVFQVQRYSKTVAFLISREKFDELIQGSDCKQCVSDLRKIAKEIKG